MPSGLGEPVVLLRTVHGSHLYGLNHKDSDEDFYTVVARAPHVAHNGSRARSARQEIVGNIDMFTVNLSTFLLYCDKGVPQALEALYSPFADIDHLQAFRYAYRPGRSAQATYLRTLRHFYKAGDVKRRKHAVRLALNLRTMREFGFFNPRLSPTEREMIDRMISWPLEEIERHAMGVST